MNTKYMLIFSLLFSSSVFANNDTGKSSVEKTDQNLEKAWQYFTQENLKKSKHYLNSVLSENSSDHRALYLKGIIAFRENDFHTPF